MNEERDLLVRAKVLLECVDTTPLQNQADLIVREITELLAQPEQEPLSEDAVGELLMGGFSTRLMDLVRMVEKAHGIGGGG